MWLIIGLFFHFLTRNEGCARLDNRELEKEKMFISKHRVHGVCSPVDSWGLLSFVLNSVAFFAQTWVRRFRLLFSSTLLLPRRVYLPGLVYRLASVRKKSRAIGIFCFVLTRYQSGYITIFQQFVEK